MIKADKLLKKVMSFDNTDMSKGRKGRVTFVQKVLND